MASLVDSQLAKSSEGEIESIVSSLRPLGMEIKALTSYLDVMLAACTDTQERVAKALVKESRAKIYSEVVQACYLG